MYVNYRFIQLGWLWFRRF